MAHLNIFLNTSRADRGGLGEMVLGFFGLGLGAYRAWCLRGHFCWLRIWGLGFRR